MKKNLFLYCITPDKPNTKLLAYLNNEVVCSIGQNSEGYYTMNGVVKSGIHKTLKRLYYPHYKVGKKKHHKKTKLKRKGSSKQKGKMIDLAFSKYVMDSKKKPVRNSSTQAVIEYWKTLNHTPQATQVPVYIKSLNCCTQADVITEDANGDLYMWEIKSGYNQRKSQGNLRKPYTHIKNNEKNHWQLQRHYTAKGLKESGLPLKGSYVINVYAQGDAFTVKRKKNIELF